MSGEDVYVEATAIPTIKGSSVENPRGKECRAPFFAGQVTIVSFATGEKAT